MDDNGIKDELPPITTFLNRLLALTIELQGILFTAFEQLLTARIEGAIASGTYDVGLETLTAESFTVTDRRPSTPSGHRRRDPAAHHHQRQRNQPVTLDDALAISMIRARSCWSTSARAAPPCRSRPSSVMLDDGEIERASG
jgi:hypothetical protein